LPQAPGGQDSGQAKQTSVLVVIILNRLFRRPERRWVSGLGGQIVPRASVTRTGTCLVNLRWRWCFKSERCGGRIFRISNLSKSLNQRRGKQWQLKSLKIPGIRSPSDPSGCKIFFWCRHSAYGRRYWAWRRSWRFACWWEA